jgi:Flp pilus assembly protein TadG
MQHLLSLSGPARQNGAIIVLIAVAMLAILAMGGLALDVSHMVLNKSRLQNTVDAAALSAAKILDQTNNTALARTEALNTMGLNAAALGNRELRDSYSGGGMAVTVQFSSTLQPFAPGTTPAEYVRVRAENFTLVAWLMRVVTLADKVVAATAVAGPSPTINRPCDVVPLVVCGTPAAQGGSAPNWGFETGEPTVLKSDSGGGSPIGPGNFQLIRLGGSGADVVRENLAGGYEGCLNGNTVPTQPGNDVGPVTQGVNTRLNVYTGPMRGTETQYPPDVVVRQTNPPLQENSNNEITQGGTVITDSSQLDFNYDDYQQRVQNGSYDLLPAPNGPATFERRILPVPIADCTGINNGQTDLPILGVACYFLLQEATQNGGSNNIYGEFVEECQARGMPGPNPTNIPGPYRIQLYRDYDSRDS